MQKMKRNFTDNHRENYISNNKSNIFDENKVKITIYKIKIIIILNIIKQK
jgi:hypothetical protein